MSCCKSKTEKQNPTTISISENHDLRIKVHHLLAIWFQATPADIFHLIVNFWYHITCNIKSEIWVFGGRNAGKGTLVKQFCRKNNELSQIDVSEFLSFIHWSMMKDMQTLCRQVIELYKNHSIAITIAPETGILRKEFIKLQLSTIGLFPQIVGKMKSLWNDVTCFYILFYSLFNQL